MHFKWICVDVYFSWNLKVEYVWQKVPFHLVNLLFSRNTTCVCVCFFLADGEPYVICCRCCCCCCCCIGALLLFCTFIFRQSTCIKYKVYSSCRVVYNGWMTVCIIYRALTRRHSHLRSLWKTHVYIRRQCMRGPCVFGARSSETDKQTQTSSSRRTGR